MNYWAESSRNIYVAAHRGLSARYPENTMLAFQKAAEAGVDQIETDVRMTKDGELILIHDSSAARTTDRQGNVEEMTLEEVRRLDAGIRWGEQFRGLKVPTLREFMDYVSQFPALTLDIELKEYPTKGNERLAYSACDKTIAMLEEYGFGDRIVLNTFSGVLHEYIQDKYGDRYRRHVYYPISYLGKGLTRDPYAGAFCCCMFRTMYHGEMNMAEPEEFAKMAALGVEPWAGAGVKTQEDVDQAIRCGATLITCNNGDEVLQFLRNRGCHQ